MMSPSLDLVFAENLVMSEARVHGKLFIRADKYGIPPNSRVEITLSQRQEHDASTDQMISLTSLNTLSAGFFFFKDPFLPGDHEVPVFIEFPYLGSSFSYIFFSGLSVKTHMTVNLVDFSGKTLCSRTKKVKVRPNTQMMSQRYATELSLDESKPVESTCSCLSRSKLRFQYSLKIDRNIVNINDHIQATLYIKNISKKDLNDLKIGFATKRSVVYSDTTLQILEGIKLPSLSPDQFYEQSFLLKMPDSKVEIIDGNIVKQYVSLGVIFSDGFFGRGFSGIPVVIYNTMLDSRFIKPPFSNWSPINIFPQLSLPLIRI
jgi:hypothetical protein